MHFDVLDEQMRRFETTNDLYVLPGVFMVVRLDGRGFTRLTKDVHQFDAPFDERFRDFMLDTTEHLVANSGFNVLYANTHSDEISLLLPRDEPSFQRKIRKVCSILAGEASAKLSLMLGSVAVFDCRVSQLPSVSDVVDYFRWRAADAQRNALNSHGYWLLRKANRSAGEATSAMKGLTTPQKHDLLYRHGVNFNDLPAWQKRGSGLYWEEYDRTATNPITGAEVTARRRRLKRDLDLPMKDDYSAFIRAFVASQPEPAH